MTDLIPNSELVAACWAKAAIDGISSDGVATKLPDPPWDGDEFVQIMNVGGAPGADSPLYEPVVSFNCYAMTSGSLKPPWNKAAGLAQRLILATYRIVYAPDPRVLLTLPTGYGPALVTSVHPVSDLRRVPSDPSHYAVYNVDIQFSWVPAGLVIA